MLTSVEGVYRNGKVELTEFPEGIDDETHVIVTFMPSSGVLLQEHGINKEQAAELRARLSPFEDWNAPEMDVYDSYDAPSSN